ncbi:MAG TPA: endonuclease/exonuclease/phosphatase family protein [Humisphaera sp.]
MTTEVLTPPAPPRRSAVRRAVGLVLRLWPFWALPALLVVYTGWVRTSAGGASGDAFHGTVSPAAAAKVRADGRFRVGIYNIQGAVGKQDPAILKRIAETVAQTDVCGLTEVRGNSYSADRRNQAQMLGEEIGHAWLFAPSERRFWRDSNGNGVVARVPVGPWARLPLPDTGEPGTFRNVVLMTATLGGKPVRVLVAHADRGPARADQMRAIGEVFASVQAPAVLLADLNGDPFDPLLKHVMSAPGAADVISDRIGAKDKRVDWIVTRGLKVVDAGRVEDGSSDHAFFWADLELEP